MATRRPLVHLVVAVLAFMPLVIDWQNAESYTTEHPSPDGDDASMDNQTTSAATETPTVNLTEAATSGTVAPSLVPRAPAESDVTGGPTVPSAAQPMTSSSACACDLTPDFCDIGCCCDVGDCGVADLASVFSGCTQETRSGACVDGWLMFRANVDPALLTVTDSLFCVRREDEKGVVAQSLSGPSGAPFSISSPYFSLQEPTTFSSLNTNFYKADDIILTYYTNTSVVSILSQPSPGAASSTCMDRNPAKFLQSSSLFCSRAVSAVSCMRDSSLSVQAYYTAFSILRIPRPSKIDIANLTIPVIPLSQQPQPIQHNGSCLNMVSKVEYTITYTGIGEITQVTLKVDVTNASFNTQLLQQHSVQFQLATPSPPPSKTPLVGLTDGSPVIGWFGEQAQPLTVQGLSEGGQCSVDPLNRSPVLFKHNSITGCTFRSASRDCPSLRAQLYSILRGDANPERVAMTAGSQPDWSRVIVQECPDIPAGELCETGCLLPVSLFVQVLWAQRGLLALPQSHILGAKYSFSCQLLQCPITSPVPVTTEVIFSDATVYPEAPRGQPKPDWKFPFAFFTRGSGELDGEL
ncbi:tectonic-3-like isoform X2 [Brachyhypopomus gauderio]|uniref:tectonic-3-like isoform X2 n=1 Tax=Brachyhypopomus gauderio TaxID=698409 RepID=UPI0040411F64